MEVAAVAWENMTPAMQAKATALLKLNPDYENRTGGIAPKDRKKFAFVRAANLSDMVKWRSGYVDARPNSDGDRPDPTKSTTTQNIGYVDKLHHKDWHFVDLPFSPEHIKIIAAAVPSALTQIAVFRAMLSLGFGLSDDIRSYDLAWLLAVVGDVHQPLHATQRFTAESPKGDSGGNKVKIERGSDCSSVDDLHSSWDGVLGTNDDHPATAAAAASHASDTKLTAIADQKVALPHIGRGTGEFTLSKSTMMMPRLRRKSGWHWPARDLRH